MEKGYEISQSHVVRSARRDATIGSVTVACFLFLMLVLESPHLSSKQLWIIVGSFALVPFIYFSTFNRAIAGWDEERKYKIYLVPTGIRYRWPGNESDLLFSEVESVKVKGNLRDPKSIVFKMKSGVLHEIAHYEGMNEVLAHVQSKVPLSRFEFNI